jgi:D-alanine-D-alanine ligase-like ATP-grasp enzyme
VREPWRLDPLAWIHRVEAAAIARELGVPVVSSIPSQPVLLRLSDPVMRRVVREMRAPYFGPGSAALERCYDKLEANRVVAAAGIEVPRDATDAPCIMKPRRGSDSIGVRVIDPPSRAPDGYLVQERIVGDELTVGVFRDRVGMPLHILLPPGTPYSFMRKYFFRPGRRALPDEAVRAAALKAASALGVDWAARVDFIRESGTGRLVFLECDAAPLVGPDSAFAASFAAAGVPRAGQLEWLLS